MEVISLEDFNPKLNRRGRPAGKAAVSVPKGLCLHDLAFMRAIVQGVDLRAAGARFLPEVHSDLRVIRSYLADVAEQAQAILVAMGQQVLAAPLKASLLSAPASSSVKLPSLAEFAQELDDPEAWSEAELLEMYQDRYGDQLAEKPTPQKTLELCLQALTQIQSSGIRLPHLNDAVEDWLSPALVRHLHAVSIRQLSQLTCMIRKSGRHWYRRVPGIGKDRGMRLLQWLQDHANFLEPVQIETLPKVATCEISASSAGALLRTTGTNALGADSDRQAVQAWISTLGFLSPHTQKAYSRDVGRLVLWAQQELGKGLSELTVVDATAHALFLQNPPAHWCTSAALQSGAQMKMRGALSPSSTARALAAIGHFYGFLVETQYLKANPFSRIRTPHERGMQMDVQRCFSNSHLQQMEQVLTSMEDGACKRRLMAILALLEGTGLRIGEIPTSWGAVVDQFDASAGTITCLRVVGKGGRERLLPLKSEILSALREHANDQVDTAHLAPADRPLIGRIGEAINSSAMPSNGALSTGRLRKVLTAFFQEAAKASPSPEMAADFERSTPHFMRHTFAHRVLNATQQDLAVTQLLLGHKSISTTGIYVKADLSQRLQAIGALSIQTSKGVMS